MRKKLHKVLFFFLLSFTIIANTKAQTLSAGDIAIIGYNSDDISANDDFCFILLTDIPINTTINFTDFGWCSGIDFTGFQKPVACGANTGAASDGAITWKSTSAMTAGTQVRIQCKNVLTTNFGTVTGLQATYNVPGEYMTLATGGDQIFAFQGTLASPTLITGINMDGNWLATMSQCQFTASQSSLPSSLSSTNSIAIAPEVDNAVYNCVLTSGTPTALRAAIFNIANWTVNNDVPFTLPLSSTFTAGTCSAPAITGNPPNRTICVGNNTSFSVTATGTGITYQWQVNFGVGFTNLSNGSPYSGVTTSTLAITGATGTMSGYAYRCVVTGTCGTATSNSSTLNVVQVTTSGSQTNVSCYGGINGNATVIPGGGITPYTYSWSPAGGTSATASSLTQGSYTVTVTDNIGCQATRNFVITEMPLMTATILSRTDASCYGSSNGTAAISVSGGAGNYSYDWTPGNPNGDGTNTVIGLTAGTYTCWITDAYGCTTSKAVTINQPAALTSSVITNNAACIGVSNGSATVSPVGGTAGYTYEWFPSGGYGASAEDLATGNYFALIADANGCTLLQPVTIGVNTGTQTGALAAQPGNGAVVQTQPVSSGSETYSDGNCNLVTTLQPAGASPVSGNVTSKVWVENSVPSIGNKPYVARHYEITPENNPETATGIVTLYFLQSEFNDFNAAFGSVLDLPSHPSDAVGIANLRIGKYSGTSSDNSGLPGTYTNGSILINPDDANIIWNPSIERWEVSFEVDGFSGFIAQTSTFTLPVTWIYFNAEENSGRVILKWQTGSELNSREFVIEHSLDGRNFASIGVVSASGNANSSTDYSFIHDRPDVNDNFYRIKEVDNDGRIMYSDVRRISLAMEDQGFKILVNPVINSKLEVQFNHNGIATIYNSFGQVVKREVVVKGSRVIDCNGLSQGTYIIKSGTESKRFLIRN